MACERSISLLAAGLFPIWWLDVWRSVSRSLMVIFRTGLRVERTGTQVSRLDVSHLPSTLMDL
ncbi:hypothetical protein SAMN04244581_00630 [Paracoccus denitrificans]|nr:hypothetical protein SAMN04244581_00630 [Paracoccus denitrificans]SFQ97972.1 hypothetical protein SAMN04244569_00626 [Paracoccus denitrificans]